MARKKSRILLPICLALLVMIAAFIWLKLTSTTQDDAYTIRITLEGESVVTMEYGQEYVELGAVGVLVGNDGQESLAVQVQADGNALGVGSHYLKYIAEYEGVTGTAYRLVHITDTQAPEIILEAEIDRYVLPGRTYVEDGFTASDNHDGDITHLVKRTETPDKVTYTVSDSSGNTTTVVRNIIYDDPVAPEITLAGDDFYVVIAGQTYEEPGFTAIDNCDGDITDRVTVSGSVDMEKLGRQTLTYSVMDTYGNETSVSRIVFVKDPSVERINDPGKTDKVVYLTFDDGPGYHTPRLLDILNKYNVQATFFVVDTAYISTISRAAEEGHTIGIHTASHKFRQIYASQNAYFRDLEKMQQIIYDYTGQTSMIMRFPGGSSNTISKFNYGIMSRLTKAVEERGFRYYDWNVDSDDAGSATTAGEVSVNVISGIQNKQNSVVLMHDIKGYTVDAVESIIVWALENGYTFLPLTEDSPDCHHGVRN